LGGKESRAQEKAEKAENEEFKLRPRMSKNTKARAFP